MNITIEDVRMEYDRLHMRVRFVEGAVVVTREMEFGSQSKERIEDWIREQAMMLATTMKNYDAFQKEDKAFIERSYTFDTATSILTAGAKP